MSHNYHHTSWLLTHDSRNYHQFVLGGVSQLLAEVCQRLSSPGDCNYTSSCAETGTIVKHHQLNR